jgi:hypothetical protein
MTRIHQAVSYPGSMTRGELPYVTPNPRNLNKAGQELLDEILTNPATKRVVPTKGPNVGALRFIGPKGVGVTFDKSGALRYFGLYR